MSHRRDKRSAGTIAAAARVGWEWGAMLERLKAYHDETEFLLLCSTTRHVWTCTSGSLQFH